METTPKPKACFKCGQEKELSEFYKHKEMSDGHVNKCKECNKKDVSKNYHGNREHYAEYERKRFQDPTRKAKAIEYQRKRRKRNPDNYIANNAVANALRDRRIVQHHCVVCGHSKTEAHHEDYTKPLDVTWLCRKHHLAVHGKKAYEVVEMKGKPF